MDHSIFIIETSLDGPVVNIIIDDIKIMIFKKSKMIEQMKSKHISIFLMIDIGPISFYLGLKVE